MEQDGPYRCKTDNDYYKHSVYKKFTSQHSYLLIFFCLKFLLCLKLCIKQIKAYRLTTMNFLRSNH